MSVGVDILDADHKILICLLNEFIDAMIRAKVLLLSMKFSRA
jgi:hypothetical protein